MILNIEFQEVFNKLFKQGSRRMVLCFFLFNAQNYDQDVVITSAIIGAYTGLIIETNL